MTHMAPFFAALQDLMLDGDPKPQRKPYSCNACRDTGETENGGACNWCRVGMADEPDDGDEVTLEQALRNMGIG